MDKSPGMTSTSKADWKRDCAKLKTAGVPFKVTGIQTDDHRKFLLDFAAKHKLAMAEGDGIVYFTPT